MINKILEIFWNWRLQNLKNNIGFIAVHTYPNFKESGWKRYREEFNFINCIERHNIIDL